MKFIVNDESMNIFNAMVQQVTETICEMKEQTEKIRVMMDEHENILGPHTESLYAALETVYMNIKRASDPAEDVAKRLAELSETCQKIIEECGR